jgi:galactonate dehydratase
MAECKTACRHSFENAFVPQVKIARIEPFCVSPRWIFVRVETDRGLVGWGESIFPRRVNAVLGALADLAANLVGEDPFAIEDLSQRMFRGGFFRGGPVLATAAAAIEQALWDIKARHYGAPIHELLGGKARRSVRAYAWVGGDRPDNVVEMARKRTEQGFTAVKMNATEELHYLDRRSKLDAVVARVDALRNAFGPDFGIAVDFHGRVHRSMAKELIRALDPFHLLWIEEPLLPENGDLLAEIARDASTPIATGERLNNRWEYKPIFEGRTVGVVQPDVSMTGVHELHTIARMAEAYDMAVAPHCPNGPICLAATLQVDACLSNVAMQEYSVGIHYHGGYAGLAPGEMQDYVLNPEVLTARNGHLLIPDGPGLGIEINEPVVRERHKLWFLRDNNWRNEDGSVAEW